jgi:hypothetical protein
MRAAARTLRAASLSVSLRSALGYRVAAPLVRLNRGHEIIFSRAVMKKKDVCSD